MTEPHRLRIANAREQLAGEIIRDYTANHLAPRLDRRAAFIEALHEAGIEVDATITIDVELLSRILFALEAD